MLVLLLPIFCPSNPKVLHFTIFFSWPRLSLAQEIFGLSYEQIEMLAFRVLGIFIASLCVLGIGHVTRLE